MSSIIKILRKNLNLTQKSFAQQLNIPLNTLRNWEQSQRAPSPWLMDLVIHHSLIAAQNPLQNDQIDEEHGILPYQFIVQKVREIAQKEPIESVVLFGSYALGKANPMSDVDIYIHSDLYHLDFLECAEKFRIALKKKVDLVSQKTIQPSSSIDKSIQKHGLIIYQKSSAIGT